MTGRWNVDGRPTGTCAWVVGVMGSGTPVDRVKLNSIHNHPRTLLEGVPSRH